MTLHMLRMHGWMLMVTVVVRIIWISTVCVVVVTVLSEIRDDVGRRRHRRYRRLLNERLLWRNGSSNCRGYHNAIISNHGHFKKFESSKNFSENILQALSLIRQFIDHAINQQTNFHYILILSHDFMIKAREKSEYS